MTEPRESQKIDELLAFAIVSDDNGQVEIWSCKNDSKLLINVEDIPLLTTILQSHYQSK